MEPDNKVVLAIVQTQCLLDQLLGVPAGAHPEFLTKQDPIRDLGVELSVVVPLVDYDGAGLNEATSKSGRAVFLGSEAEFGWRVATQQR